MTGAAVRGLRNPFRTRTRGLVVVVLLALVTGLLGLMVQAALASRLQIARLDARVRTLVELREAGAFGTGGFGGDKPIGEHDFTEGTVVSTKLTACDFKPGTCEGSLVLDTKSKDGASHGQSPEGDTDQEGHRSLVLAGAERQPGLDRVRE